MVARCDLVSSILSRNWRSNSARANGAVAPRLVLPRFCRGEQRGRYHRWRDFDGADIRTLPTLRLHVQRNSLHGAGLSSARELRLAGEFGQARIPMGPQFFGGGKFFLGFGSVASVLGDEGSGVVGAEIVGIEADH
jgi:hypothetical protein